MEKLFVTLLYGSLFVGSGAKYSANEYLESIAALKKFDEYFTEAVTDPLIIEMLGYRSLDYVRQSLSYREPSEVPDLAMKAQDLFLHHLYFSSTIVRRPTSKQMFVNAYVTYLANYATFSTKVCSSYTSHFPLKSEKPHKDPNLRARETNCNLMEAYMIAFTSITFRDRAHEFAQLVEKLKSKSKNNTSRSKTKRHDFDVVKSFIGLPYIFNKKMNEKSSWIPVLPFFWGGLMSEVMQNVLLDTNVEYYDRNEKYSKMSSNQNHQKDNFNIDWQCEMITSNYWFINQVRYFHDALENNPFLFSSSKITFPPSLEESIFIWDEMKNLTPSIETRYDSQHRSLRSQSTSSAFNSNVANILYHMEKLKIPTEVQSDHETSSDLVLYYSDDKTRESNIVVKMRTSSDEDSSSKSKFRIKCFT